jgi:hypothetical protein
VIVNNWPAAFLEKAGGFPSTFVAFDLETTGFDRKTDVIIEIGHVLVEDGVVTDELSVLLDWSKSSVVPVHWLVDRIAGLRQTLSDKGIAHHLPYERLCKEGIDPIEALRFYRDFFEQLKAQGMPVVGHNVYRFDEPMLEANLLGFQVCDEFAFGDWQLWDTLALEAATIHGPGNPKALVKADDTLRTWMYRSSYLRAETNLTRTLLKKYDLAAKHGLNTLDSHSACYDARLCHHLMQEYRAMLAVAPVKLPPVAAPSARPGRTVRQVAPRQPVVPVGVPKAPAEPDLFSGLPSDGSKDMVVHGNPIRRRGQRNR